MSDSGDSLDTRKSVAETENVQYLDPANLHFFRHGAALRLLHGDELGYLRVTLIRLFPLSDPEQFLSVRDGANQEIGILPDVARLPDTSRELVREELRRRYFVPVLQRVLTVKERFGTLDWVVETDRGVRSFTTRNLRDNLLQPAPNRYLLTDVDGNRYDVPDISTLESASQTTLLRYL